MNKNQKVLRVMEILVDSLQSHISAGAGDEPENDCCKKSIGSPRFHRICIKDYAEAVGLLGTFLP